MPEFLRFPDPVNEVSARLVALGVVMMTGALLLGAPTWLLLVVAYGFLARVASGPRFSPLGLLVTRVLVPHLPFEERLTPGPPKRFAQAIGAALSTTAVVFQFGPGWHTASLTLVAMILVAASLEAFLGFCLGCKVFAVLMRLGVIPESVCESCADISRRGLPA